MSIYYSAGLIYGWKVSKEIWDSLDDAFVEDYGVIVDGYADRTIYIVGCPLGEVGDGRALMLDDETMFVPTEIYQTIYYNLPPEITDIPARNFLYCKVW